MAHTNRDCWRTPGKLFAILNHHLGPFGLDAAAEKRNALCRRYYTVEQDALKQPWHQDCLPNEVVWVNPPYSFPNIGKFLAKAVHECYMHGQASCLLLPFSGGTVAWRKYVQHAAIFGVLSHKVRFNAPDGTPADNVHPWPIVALLFDPALRGVTVGTSPVYMDIDIR